MAHLDERRRDVPDLLARPPWAGGWRAEAWVALLVDPIAQLATLADLVAQGWLSIDEFERQKAKVLDP